jgi:hypothetical protein
VRLQALLDGLLIGRSSVLEVECHGSVAVDIVRRMNVVLSWSETFRAI